jgi:enolase
MSEISALRGREILDSRGNPTLEVEVLTANGVMGRGMVPSGASTGAFEAHELRDGDSSRYFGKGVKKAVDFVNNELASELLGQDVQSQQSLDQLLVDIDGSDNKTRLGANALLGVSLACAHAGAIELGIPLYRYLGGLMKTRLPVPLMNIINGGAHADNGLDIQEFMIVPTIEGSYSESLRAGVEVFHTLKKILSEKSLVTSVGDEGGFAPRLKNHAEALDLLCLAIEKAGYRLGEEVSLALDVAATEFFKQDRYHFENRWLEGAELASLYQNWSKKYPIVSIEDGWSEQDWSSWHQGTQLLGSTMQLVGDDLFVTNPKRLKTGIEKGVGNALLVKMNQIGTLTEMFTAVQMAHQAGYRTVMSHRSGETEDASIAHLAVACGSHQIKTGSLCRSDRTAKYNELLRISEDFSFSTQLTGSHYWGKEAFSWR